MKLFDPQLIHDVAVAAGGEFHGPNIEHLSIPESDLPKFIRMWLEKVMVECDAGMNPTQEFVDDLYWKFMDGSKFVEPERELAWEAYLVRSIMVFARAAQSKRLADAFPFVCDGKEQMAFENVAASRRYDMSQHPLHYMFLNARTDDFRAGWKCGIDYCLEAVKANLHPDTK